MVSEPFRDYDPFAWLYTHYWGDGFHQQILPALDRVVLNALPTGARVLDLCCGDGRLTRLLTGRGFHVAGLESSPAMLAYARRVAPGVEWLEADAREFTCETRFAAVLSTFDSLNHVLADDDLKRVFGNVRACLEPGGLFVFDLNGLAAYRDRWPSSSCLVEDDVVSVSRGSYETDRGLARCRVTLLTATSGQWTRSDFELVQRYYPRACVLLWLQEAGFEASAMSAAEAGMIGEFAYGRELYVARA